MKLLLGTGSSGCWSGLRCRIRSRPWWC